MTRLRRPALTLLALVLPGAAQALARRWTSAAVLGLPTVALLGLVAGAYGRQGALGAALDPTLIDRTGWALVALGALAAVSVTEVAVHEWAHPSGTVARAAGVLGVVALAACPATAGTVGLWYAGEHADTLNQVFRGGAVRAVPSDEVLGERATNDDADTPTTPRSTGITAERRAAAAATTTVPEAAGRWNVVLFGGDAGKGRSGLRTDAMVLVSVDRRTGDVALVSVPRNLARLPMPEGALRTKFPKGWTDLANAFYGYVARNPALGDGSDQAAANALKGALAEALGVPVDNYVLVDMAGFIDVIDALGGVDLTLGKAVPAPGNPYEAKHPVRAWFGPGDVHLDGTDALAYARSREGDSDYRRMERQRCLLASAARQVSPTDLLRRYDDLLGAMERSVRSDLTPAQARQLVDLYAKVDRGAIRSLGLAPPLVNTGAPNYAQIRVLVAAALEPPAAAPATPAATPATSAAPAAGTPTSTRSGTPSSEAPATVLDEDSTC